MKKIIAIALFIFSVSAMADKVNLDYLKASLNNNAEIKASKPSVIPGLYEVQINNDIVYLSADGKKIIHGDIYDLSSKNNYTQMAKSDLRKAALAAIKDEDKIIYKAKDEKYKVTVFTDISCPYCTKLHKHIAAFNDAGITIEYLAFPRAGIGSDTLKTMQNIWCADNKTQALTKAKIDQQFPDKVCQGKQATQQFLLGRDIGVNATPTIIFSDGHIKPGYLNPSDLLNILQQRS